MYLYKSIYFYEVKYGCKLPELLMNLAIFAEFAERKSGGFVVNSPEVQSLVVKLQEYITQNYYTCTNEILAGLGKMYACDGRFKKNIDKYGEGTAEFVAEAIGLFGNQK